jgi:hypothetical protein
MKPEIQIKIGLWTAIMLLVVALVNTFIVIFTFRDYISESFIRHDLIWPIIFSNGVGALFCVGFVFTISRRLLKTNLLLLVVYILLMVRTFFTWEYIDLSDFFRPFFELLVILCLSQGVIGMWREKLA